MPETTCRDARDVEIDALRQRLRESERERQRLHDLVHPPSAHQQIARRLYEVTGGSVPFGTAKRRRGALCGVTVGLLAHTALEAIAEAGFALVPSPAETEGGR